MSPQLKIHICYLHLGVGTGRNSTYAIFLGVTRCMERLHTFGHICDGIRGRDHLYAVGYFVEKGSHVPMNCRYWNYVIIRCNSAHVSFTCCVNRVTFDVPSTGRAVEACLI
jgi:hypothetical protein